MSLSFLTCLRHPLIGFKEDVVAYNLAGEERQDFLAETGTVGDRHRRFISQTWRKEQMSGLKDNGSCGKSGLV